MQRTQNPTELSSIARQIRRHIVTMITAAKSGHPGGSLSAVELLVTLYWDVLRHDPANPKWPERDRFILSKGHAAPVLYSVMAECGYTPVETQAEATFVGVTTAKIDVRPLIVSFGLAYHF